ncbi:MAG: amidase domain-containing protein [Oscillospiraceae bacterium]|nr:amidase domain-containing protein [Oscillospiraceae bacterium]
MIYTIKDKLLSMAQKKTTYKKISQKKEHTRYRRAVVAFIAIVCFFAFAWNGYKNSDFYSFPTGGTATDITDTDKNQHKPQTSAKVTDNTGVLNNRQIDLLENYASLYAQTLQSMKPQDVSHLYYDSDSRHCVVNNTALKILTDIRGMRDLDLTLEYATVEYIVKDVAVSGSKATVNLIENNTQKFRHLSQPSYNANINHIFVLIQSNDSWLIKEHQHEEDFYLLTGEGWEDAKGETNHLRGQQAYDLIIADARENLSDMEQFQQGKILDLKVADTSYNRDAAVSYAQQWWNTRNYTGNYLAYDNFGGNCQNFASQCIHAGGIDMDYTGVHDVQWKFYDEDLNNKATARGRSYSWTGVDMFYSYAVNNYADGLVTLTDIDYSYAEKGDIIHVGAYYQWRHALLVTDVLKSGDGTLQDIVVASNTADRWNYPLSAYIYTGARLIHILGQN